MRAADNVLKGVVPCYGAIKTGMKLAQQNQPKGRGKKKHSTRLTEISRGSGKPVLCQGVNINQAARKLFDYEETGLTPYEVRILIERERNLTEQVKKMQEW